MNSKQNWFFYFLCSSSSWSPSFSLLSTVVVVVVVVVDLLSWLCCVGGSNHFGRSFCLRWLDVLRAARAPSFATPVGLSLAFSARLSGRPARPQ